MTSPESGSAFFKTLGEADTIPKPAASGSSPPHTSFPQLTSGQPLRSGSASCSVLILDAAPAWHRHFPGAGDPAGPGGLGRAQATGCRCALGWATSRQQRSSCRDEVVFPP